MDVLTPTEKPAPDAPAMQRSVSAGGRLGSLADSAGDTRDAPPVSPSRTTARRRLPSLQVAVAAPAAHSPQGGTLLPLQLRLLRDVEDRLEEVSAAPVAERPALLRSLLAVLPAPLPAEHAQLPRVHVVDEGTSPLTAGDALAVFLATAVDCEDSEGAASEPSPATAAADFLHWLDADVLPPCWGADGFPEAYALLTYAAVAAGGLDGGVFTSPAACEVFAAGVNRLCWRDVDSGSAEFARVYASLRALATSPPLLARLPPKGQLEAQLLACRFFLYYAAAGTDVDTPRLLAFLRALPALEDGAPGRPPAGSADSLGTLLDSPLGGAPSSASPLARATALLVHEVTGGLMRRLRNERSTLRLLVSLPSLAGLRLGPYDTNRLLSALAPFANPGGPLYPSREVRRAAVAASTALSPTGARVRRAVRLLFRLAYPLRYPGKALNWAIVELRRCCARSGSSGGDSDDEDHDD